MQAALNGPAVRKARESRNLSQSEVANAMGLNRVYYSLFEAGRYVLDLDEQKRLSQFLTGQGFEVSDVSTGEPSAARSETSLNPATAGESVTQDDSDDDDSGDSDTSFLTALRALYALADAAETSGIDSKRTAAMVATAANALQSLDYTDLLSVFEEFEVAPDGLPPLQLFVSLPLPAKELWESRAAGMLICVALYGDDWQKATCRDLERVATELRRRVPEDRWNVRRRSLLEELFEDAEKFSGRYRCDLAPHVTAAAANRLAPALLLRRIAGSGISG